MTLCTALKLGEDLRRMHVYLPMSWVRTTPDLGLVAFKWPRKSLRTKLRGSKMQNVTGGACPPKVFRNMRCPCIVCDLATPLTDQISGDGG